MKQNDKLYSSTFVQISSEKLYKLNPLDNIDGWYQVDFVPSEESTLNPHTYAIECGRRNVITTRLLSANENLKLIKNIISLSPSDISNNIDPAQLAKKLFIDYKNWYNGFCYNININEIHDTKVTEVHTSRSTNKTFETSYTTYKDVPIPDTTQLYIGKNPRDTAVEILNKYIEDLKE